MLHFQSGRNTLDRRGFPALSFRESGAKARLVRTTLISLLDCGSGVTRMSEEKIVLKLVELISGCLNFVSTRCMQWSCKEGKVHRTLKPATWQTRTSTAVRQSSQPCSQYHVRRKLSLEEQEDRFALCVTSFESRLSD